MSQHHVKNLDRKYVYQTSLYMRFYNQLYPEYVYAVMEASREEWVNSFFGLLRGVNPLGGLRKWRSSNFSGFALKG